MNGDVAPTPPTSVAPPPAALTSLLPGGIMVDVAAAVAL